MKRWVLRTAIGLLGVWFTHSGVCAEGLPIEKTRVLARELSALLQAEGACRKTDALVKEYLGRGLPLGNVVETIFKACGDLEAVVFAALDAGVAADVTTQAAIFAGGDPVDVASVLEKYRADGGVLAYTPSPLVGGLDQSQQVVPPQVSPVLWGNPVRDAGPDRTRPALSPSGF